MQTATNQADYTVAATGSATAGSAAADSTQDRIFLGRQPILGRQGELVAYELLFRADFSNTADVVDDFAATATVIDSAFMSLGVQRAIGDKTAFINVNAEILMSDMLDLLPRDRVVLEILEHVELTHDLVERCLKLKRDGFRIALDDVTELRPEQEAMLGAIDYVKFDLRDMALEDVPALVQLVHAHGVAAIAEKLETQAEFEACRAAGADLFQGYFFARPVVISARAVQPPKPILVTLLRLLSADVDVSVLESTIKGAPDLTVRLLRLANAAGMRSAYKITSLRGAILRIGTTQIRRMVQVSLLARRQDADISSDPLVQAAAIRGHLMESLAVAKGMGALREEAFMVGILSLAGSVFGQTMIDLLQILNLGESLHEALLLRAGPLGELLAFVEACEQFDAPAARTMLRQLSPVEMNDLNRMQVDAIGWASSL